MVSESREAGKGIVLSFTLVEGSEETVSELAGLMRSSKEDGGSGGREGSEGSEGSGGGEVWS